jgi:hypothetical protein
VYRTRDKLLSGSRFARYQHRRKFRGDLSNSFKKLQHLRRFTDDVVDRARSMLRLFERTVLGNKPSAFERAADYYLQLFVIERLLNKIVRAELERLTGRVDGAERRHHYHAYVRVDLADAAEHFDTVQIRHTHVGNYQIAMFLFYVSNARTAVDRGRNLVALGTEHNAQHLAVAFFIIYDQDLWHWLRLVRQFYHKMSSFAEFRFDIDAAAVIGNDLMDDRKPESGSA